VAPILEDVSAAAVDRPGWSAAQFANAALSVLTSPYKAVTKTSVEKQFGSHLTANVDQQLRLGEPILEALVKANKVSLRPHSGWALDIPAEAGFAFGEVIVTAPSTVHLYCMGAIKPQLEDILQRWQTQKQQVCR
jgi:hypothetical protein